jgi:AAA family ATP:ADP antiporter
MLITGGIFFAFFMMEGHSIYSTLPIVVMLGTVQIVLIKGVKYALFDATKEMAFIPADEQIRSKGKAAVDVVGLRMAKASGSLVQSLLFMIFPMANYLTLAPYMIIAVAIICVLWIKTVFSLNQQYVALTET